MTSSEPSMKFGDAWWSTIVVVPASSASRPPRSAEARTEASSRARSSRHQTLWRISVKLPGGASRNGMPRAKAE